MSDLGLMLYTNGYNPRGISTRHPNGLVYFDGDNLFGIGHFRKEGGGGQHLHIVAPKGPSRISAVRSFISTVRAAGLARNSVYVRQLPRADRTAFLTADFLDIESDPWHPDAPEEDETYPNRIYHLAELLEEQADGSLRIRNLPGQDRRKYRNKNRLAYRRFRNFLDRNDHLRLTIEPYGYSAAEAEQARSVVEGSFAARRKHGTVIGSTPEDYTALIRQRPGGVNERDYFAYLGNLSTADGLRVPVMFFAGERVSEHRATLYCTMTMRLPERLEHLFHDLTGFTAIPQYVWLSFFQMLWRLGIREVDAGGSEARGLDDQKRQLGGKPAKTHWVVLPGAGRA